ncbi:MAG: NIL domain-containing protein [Abditibacteriaceae bacterium]
MRDRIHLTFPKERIADPVMCNVAKQFDVVYSIRRANVEAGAGWMDLEFTGEDAEIDRVIAYLQEKGLRVDPIEGDIVAG